MSKDWEEEHIVCTFISFLFSRITELDKVTG